MLITLLICCISFFLGISSLGAVEAIEDIHGNVVFVYTEAEHANVRVLVEEITQWREVWPQFQYNYNAVVDNHDIWKTNYTNETAKNWDLRFQRNVMVGITGITIVSVVASILLGLLGE